MNEIKKVYQSFNKDPLEVNDLEEALKQLGRDPVECELMPMMHDINSSGNTVNFDEFITILSTTADDTSIFIIILVGRIIFDALSELDNEGNGFIGPKALKKIILSMGVEIDEETFEDVLKESQKNNQGKIDIQSFVTCLVGDSWLQSLKRKSLVTSPISINQRVSISEQKQQEEEKLEEQKPEEEQQQPEEQEEQQQQPEEQQSEEEQQPEEEEQKENQQSEEEEEDQQEQPDQQEEQQNIT